MNARQERQDLLNRSVRHVRRQGEPSISPEGQCRYNHKGRKCAAGPFIKSYSPAMESVRWTSLCASVTTREALEPLAVKHGAFVLRLQYAHDKAAAAGDNSNFIKYYEILIRQLCVEEGLSYPPRVAMGGLTY